MISIPRVTAIVSWFGASQERSVQPDRETWIYESDNSVDATPSAVGQLLNDVGLTSAVPPATPPISAGLKQSKRLVVIFDSGEIVSDYEFSRRTGQDYDAY